MNGKSLASLPCAHVVERNHLPPTTPAQGRDARHSGTPEERAYIAASDRLRECQRRMDALGRRWHAGDMSVREKLDEAFAEFRRLQSDYFRCKAIAIAATKARARRGAP